MEQKLLPCEAVFIMNCGRYSIKKRQILLQNKTRITNSVEV